VKEATIERYLCDRVKELGGIAYKFRSPARKHVPDRMVVLPGGIAAWIEVKAPGEVPRPGQWRELYRLQELGHWATYVDTKARVDAYLELIRGLASA